MSVAAVLVVLVGLPILALSMPRAPSTGPSDALATNPYVDPGTRLSGPAPDFTLTDEFGQPVSLHAFRGKVVILAFNDSECTTICPLTTTAMLAAKRMMGAASSQVQLLGVDANPKATALQDVLSYSQLHGMLREWHFLTGSLSQLKRVWSTYHIEAAIEAGQIAHTPAVYVIDPHGKLAKIYTTQQSYTSIDQQAQVFADEASALLPGHPRVRSTLTYTQIPTSPPPTASACRGRAAGPSASAPVNRALLLFFATWNQQTTSLAGQLETLDRYSVLRHSREAAGADGGRRRQRRAIRGRAYALPRTTCPTRSPTQSRSTSSGRVADGYEVQGEPWFVLTAPTGRILWYWEVSSSGWPSPTALAQRRPRRAGSRASALRRDLAAAQHELAGSPAPLAALHQQADRLLGTEHGARRPHPCAARLPDRAQRMGLVVPDRAARNSACSQPRRRTTGVTSHSSAQTPATSAGDARAFLTQHPVSYPSYQTTTTDLASLAPIQGLPDDDLHQPHRPSHLRTHRPVRLARVTRRRHRDLRARRLNVMSSHGHAPSDRRLAHVAMNRPPGVLLGWSRGAIRARPLILLALAILAITVPTRPAHADGDPASDVLIGENVFYPYSPTVSPALQSTLNAETAAASREHFPIKVALIASPVDLGAITSLYGQPQNYADFLEQEISYLDVRQLVLVVMANGYGVSGLDHRATLVARKLTKPAGRDSNDLARAAIAAVATLASAAGHPIKNIRSTTVTSSSSGWQPPTAAILALAAIAAALAILAFRYRNARAP